MKKSHSTEQQLLIHRRCRKEDSTKNILYPSNIGQKRRQVLYQSIFSTRKALGKSSRPALLFPSQPSTYIQSILVMFWRLYVTVWHKDLQRSLFLWMEAVKAMWPIEVVSVLLWCGSSARLFYVQSRWPSSGNGTRHIVSKFLLPSPIARLLFRTTPVILEYR